jgi:transcriptional regulator of arginine metabolism
MPRTSTMRDLRRDAIIEILTTEKEKVKEQKDLVELLRERGFEVTQSSVSRDLKALGISRYQGRYEVPMTSIVGEDFPLLFEHLKQADTAGPYQALLTTSPSAAGLVARVIEAAGWPEVTGVIASEDKVLVLTKELQDQRRLFNRLRTFMMKG